MPEKLTDRDDLIAAVWNDNESYTVISNHIIEQTRWAVLVETVFRRLSDDKLFITTWRKAATEMQDHEYPDEANECEAYTETVTKYRKIA